MTEYHKIQTLFKRDMESPRKTLIEGQWTLPEFEYLAGNDWVWTEKVDGTNIRVIFQNGQLTFGGRTAEAQIPAPLVNRLNNVFLPLLPKFVEIFDPSTTVVLYGEGYGAKIQKGGGNYRQDQDFVLFDVRVEKWWLRREDVEDLAIRFDIMAVPVIGTGTLYEAINFVRKGFPSRWGSFPAEGIVARPETELMTRAGERIITKIKTRDFQ